MKLARRRPRKFLQRLTILNAAVLVLLYILEARVAERHWLTTLITYAPQQLFGAPTALLLLWSLVRRNRRFAAANAVVAGSFALTLLGFNIPIHAGRTAKGPSVRVMTYNTHHGLAGVNRIARDVRSIRPDLVCFQETNPIGRRPDPLPQLEQALPGWHCASFSELAVFSKWPILGHELHMSSAHGYRVFLQVDLQVRGRRLSVICLHLDTAMKPESLANHRGRLSSYLRGTADIRSLQVSELLHVTRHMRGPLIIAGDFNTPPRGRTYGRMAGKFQDCFRRAGWGPGYSFRSDLPVMRIDYIWAGRGVTPCACNAPALAGSDHRPVVADIILAQ